MGEVSAAAALGSCRHHLPFISRGEKQCRRYSATRIKQWKSNTENKMKRAMAGHHHYVSMSAVAAAGPVTFSSSISTDIPLYEPPGVSFDEYMQDRNRVFNAMFPDTRRSMRLNDKEWRIQMLPMEFLFASVRPVVVMRLSCKSEGQDYPPGVPRHATRVLDLQAARWELHGLDSIYMPSNFSLSVQGALYADRGEDSGGCSRLKGQLEMSISLVLPPVFALVPRDILKRVAEAVLRRLMEKMKQEVDAGLLRDFGNFRREKLMTTNTHAYKRAKPLQDDERV